MPAPTKQTLERCKLQVEITKLQAEAESAVINARELQRNDLARSSADWHHRVYNFLGSVSTITVEQCITSLTTWARMDPGCDITLILNSPGGSVIDGLALYDVLIDLRRKGHRVTTVARGMAASMGGILLQAGDERVVEPNAHVLIHEVSSGAIGKISEIEDEMAFLRQLQNRLLGILEERSTLSVEEIRQRWERKDWWLGAVEAVELGFADRVG